jgi:hypothetical protein
VLPDTFYRCGDPVVTGSDFSDHLMRAKLTPAFVIKAATDLERVILWDEAMPGFGLMVTRNGHKSYVVD